jgi:cytoplasmic iron level regulating protein YaaA (DUF328/UPF0246 family)
LIVLLPPSAGQATPAGPPVELAALAFADRLTRQRGRLLRALELSDAPAAPAAEVFTGVLYAQLGLADVPWENVLIASALFGLVRPGDRICATRVDMGSKVPRLRESLTAYWKPALARLPDPGFVLDLRSGSYAAAWRPANSLGVRGLAERPDGTRAVITHLAKRVRGDVARVVLTAPEPPESPADVAALATAAGLRVELTGATLDVIE